MHGHDVTTWQAWHELTTLTPAVGRFDPADVADLPAPARRLLEFALEPGVALSPIVVLAMEGRIRLRAWMSFTARQVLHVGRGMVWAARVGPRPLTVSGSDLLWRGRAGLDFWLWGRVPVAHAVGPDVDLSTIGRMAAETVAWAPQGLLPALGATWLGLDDRRAVVVLTIEGHEVHVVVTVDDTGRLRELELDRWGDPETGVFGWHVFGGTFTDHATFDGVTIPTAGRVGWDHGTRGQAAGEFLEFAITDARFPNLAVDLDRPPVLLDT
ncbi:DUF6544 family protein [Salsipaludibacter albus]|uniref:DUF6544 family protein n=1 Tax=Salsipaludibacter albus TaxID=2849650 RepID=UPI001EE4D4C2|nr:DUF6544 family protein [Salsipaludibacter albus]MBY5162031.1 hypothetical protein [Salsipaludibacter albus]